MSRKQKQTLMTIVVAAVIFIVALLVSQPVFRLILFIVAYLLSGFSVLKEAGENIIHGEIFDENFLLPKSPSKEKLLK